MSAGPLTLAIASRATAAERLALELTGEHATDRFTLDCARLRSCLWAESNGATNAVHVNRLLNLAVSISRGTVDDEDDAKRRAALREALDELADVGDVAELANGRWIPAPMREITLSGVPRERILLGGIPTTVLPSILRDGLTHRGPFRRTTNPRLSGLLGIECMSVDAWLGPRVSDLRAWGASVLDADLASYDGDCERARFLVYAPVRSPALQPFTPQGFRWTENLSSLRGRYLAMRELPFGAREPRVVEISSGRVIATGAPDLGDGDVRRLQYAIDATSNAPTEVRVAHTHESMQLTLKSEVPRRERRLFAALGQLNMEQEKYYPRRWFFGAEHADLILSELTALEVAVRR